MNYKKRLCIEKIHDMYKKITLLKDKQSKVKYKCSTLIWNTFHPYKKPSLYTVMTNNITEFNEKSTEELNLMPLDILYGYIQDLQKIIHSIDATLPRVFYRTKTRSGWCLDDRYFVTNVPNVPYL